jgi:hypothetical protein
VVKCWNARPGYFASSSAYHRLYLVHGQWFHHAGDLIQEAFAPRTCPNYATFLTREQARDWFLAVEVPLPEELADLRPAACPSRPPEEPACLITLSQAAGLVHRSKRALEDYKRRGMPQARVRGGGGKPGLWAYAELRPWLMKTFDLVLPERFFADRNHRPH